MVLDAEIGVRKHGSVEHTGRVALAAPRLGHGGRGLVAVPPVRVVLIVCLSLLCPLATGAGPVGHRPNIIFLHTDSWDGRALGCMDHAAMKRATPNIDRLAARGTLFRNTYCSHPICCPSRANMWSGMYTHHCESWNNHKGLEPGATTFKTRLEQVGYRFATARGGYGKHDYTSGAHSQLARVTAWTGGADIRLPVFRMRSPQVYSDRRKRVQSGDWDTIDKARQFLEDHADDGQPFFLYASLNAPHPPFTTSRAWLDRIDQAGVTIPPADEQYHPVMAYQRITKNWQHGFTDEMVRKVRRIYYAMCCETDAMVGELLDDMDRLGLADHTYFIFSSDHGENAMEHGQFYKMNCYESSVRVPLVVSGPGVKVGGIVDNVVSLIDLHPTFMDMGRAECPEGLDGESLMPLLEGKTPRSRNWALAMFTGCTSNTTMFMLREGDWKYIAYPGFEPQLFNLADDPDEIRNRASMDPGVTKRMDTKLRRIVDYEEVHQRCMRYNKASFRRWRAEARAGKYSTTEYGRDKNDPADTYEEIMQNTYMGWTAEHEDRLNRWLDQE